jgi:hypothetical protein
MKIRKRDTRGGLIMKRVFHEVASVGQNAGEHVNIVPMEINGKRYAVALYYPSRPYWGMMFRNAPLYFLSFFYPSLFMRASSLAEIVQGVKVMDESPKTIPYERNLYLDAFHLSLAWIEIYIHPFFPPRLVRIYDARFRRLEQTVNRSKETKYPKTEEKWERDYFEQVRIADEQLVSRFRIVEKQNPVIHNLLNAFRQVSNGLPTDRGISRTKDSAARLKATFIELAEWCKARAETWPNFVDAYTLYKINMDEKQSPFKRLGWRVLIDTIPGVLIALFTSVPVGIGVGMLRELGGYYYNKFVARPKWQANRLKRLSLQYLKDAERTQLFLDLFERKLDQRFVRA